MIDHPYLSEICARTDSKILLLVVDGLGGLPHPETGISELELAHTPNLDALARRSACGLTIPVGPGITPGSGPGHLALFGYDPLKYVIGRGVLEALGIGVELGAGDVAVRCNFCTVDGDGLLTDRRAGRIPSAEAAPLVDQLKRIELDGAKIEVRHVQDYRFVVVFRGNGENCLGRRVSDTDPQRVGVRPLEPAGLDAKSQTTAALASAFTRAARDILGGRDTANMALMRGFSSVPTWPPFGNAYKLNPCAIAAYPMYRGLASLVGMRVIPTGADFDAELDTLEARFAEHDFAFLHYKPADAAGEDGDFEGKVRAIEALDRRIPRVLALGADVLAVAGDHSTPATISAHSWHPVPALVNSRWTGGDGAAAFSEREFRTGSLATQPATSLMLQLMAHAGKLDKFGA